MDNCGYWISKHNEKIYICGVGDYYTDTQLLDKALDGVRPDDFWLLISHKPDYVHHIIQNKQIDLVLCGHIFRWLCT